MTGEPAGGGGGGGRGQVEVEDAGLDHVPGGAVLQVPRGPSGMRGGDGVIGRGPTAVCSTPVGGGVGDGDGGDRGQYRRGGVPPRRSD